MFGLRRLMKNLGRQLFFWLLLSLCAVGPLNLIDTRYEPGLVEVQILYRAVYEPAYSYSQQISLGSRCHPFSLARR